MKNKSPLYWMAFTAAFTLAALAVERLWFPATSPWINEPFHSAVEGIGALIAILTAFILVYEGLVTERKILVPVALGLLGMGLFDCFHAIAAPYHGFVLLRSLAGLVGGLGFATLWVVPFLKREIDYRKLIWSATILYLLLGLLFLFQRDYFPAMLLGREFSVSAIALNLTIGALFLAAAARLLMLYHQNGSGDFGLFAVVAFLFGISHLQFKYSVVWEYDWWLWHFLRLAAYLLVFGYILNRFFSMISGLRTAIKERTLAEEALQKAHDELEIKVEERTSQLKEANNNLEEENSRRELVEKRLEHINSVLLAIRNVNQLAVKERDPDKLIRASCESLTGTRGYFSAWITLLDEYGKVTKAAESGLGKKSSAFTKEMKKNGLPGCGVKALRQDSLLITEDITGSCGDCLLAQIYPGECAMTVRLEHGGKVFGVMSVSLDREYAVDEEEQGLLLEMAGDIAFALSSIDLARTLRKSEQNYRTLVDNLPQKIFFKDRNFNWISCNANMANDLKLAPEEVAGKTDYDLFPRELADKYLADDRRIMEAGVTEDIEEKYVQNGREVWVQTVKTPVRDDKGDFSGILGIFWDITRRKLAEQKLEVSLENLKRTNAELEQFAYVASHDLQEPLRKVSSYVQLLAHRYRSKLDSDADDFIGFAVDGAMRMQRLIEDLLTFSRVGTRGMPFEPCDCDEVLKRTLANLEMKINEGEAEITYDKLPTIPADCTQIMQLFQNLIENSIKFHSDEKPRVHISVKRNKGEWVFAVRDNGIGIDPQYFDRIFIVFQRLHSKQDYPGTGIGLSICKKIVERHGGRIWIDSAPGTGATFHFTIPARSKANG